MEHIWREWLVKAYGAAYDESYAPIYHDSGSSYEDSAWMCILEKDSQLYILKYSYSPYAQDSTPVWDLEPVTEAQAIQEMIAWEQINHD